MDHSQDKDIFLLLRLNMYHSSLRNLLVTSITWKSTCSLKLNSNFYLYMKLIQQNNLPITAKNEFFSLNWKDKSFFMPLGSQILLLAKLSSVLGYSEIIVYVSCTLPGIQWSLLAMDVNIKMCPICRKKNILECVITTQVKDLGFYD